MIQERENTNLEEIHILLVEDNEALNRSISNFLNKTGYSYYAVHDGQEAIDQLDLEQDWDVVLLDLMLPKVNGFEILAHINQLSKSPKVIVMTGKGTEREMLDCLGKGCDFVLEKPFTLQELKLTIGKTMVMADNTGSGFKLQSEMGGWVELVADSYFEFLERFKNATQIIKNSHNIDDVTRQDIVLTLDELGRNAIEWGNERDSKKKFSISFAVFSNEIVFRISDEGAGFKQKDLDPEENVLTRLMNRKKEGKRPGGFGLTMVKQLMDNVVYNTAGNTVLISKKI